MNARISSLLAIAFLTGCASVPGNKDNYQCKNEGTLFTSWKLFSDVTGFVTSLDVPNRYTKEKLRFETKDGVTLRGWKFEPKSKTNNDLIFVMQGNAIPAATVAEFWLEAQSEDNYYPTIIAFDYRGYGLSLIHI